MSIVVTTREDCIAEHVHVQFAYQSFVLELDCITSERKLLHQEATHSLEEAAAEKLRKEIHDELLHHGK